MQLNIAANLFAKRQEQKRAKEYAAFDDILEIFSGICTHMRTIEHHTRLPFRSTVEVVVGIVLIAHRQVCAVDHRCKRFRRWRFGRSAEFLHPTEEQLLREVSQETATLMPELLELYLFASDRNDMEMLRRVHGEANRISERIDKTRAKISYYELQRVGDPEQFRRWLDSESKASSDA